jgi:23S rRNA (uracil1939-C5)-methyltransferase
MAKKTVSKQTSRPKIKTNKPKTAKPEEQTIKLTIESIDREGIGLARHEGKTVLVQGAFPGDTVVVEVEHVGRTHIYTHLRKVLRNAPARSSRQLCRQTQSCLGCTLIAMQYPQQLTFKHDRVAAALAEQQVASTDQIAATLAAEQPCGYRASAKLTFARKREKVLVGLYRRGSHEVVDCPDCAVHHPLINRIVAVVRDEVQRQGISVYSAQHQHGLLRYLLIRVSPINNKALVTFVCNFKDHQQLPKLAKWLTRKVPEVIGVHQNINSSTGNVIIGNETHKLLGLPDLIDRVGDISLRMAPESFFQINTLQAAKLYRMVRQWAGLTRADATLDLYCGIGGIALHLAQDAGRVEGVEYVAQAVRNATENARLNQLGNCRFHAGDAAELVEEYQAQGDRFDLVTLNPPRKGCDTAVLNAVGQMQPRQIIYVSCDPDSLARDLAILKQYGYGIEQIQPVDMFPQTAHIETVVQLKLTSPQ